MAAGPGGDNQSLPFPAREGGDDSVGGQSGVEHSAQGLILEHQCSEASDCSDRGGSDRAKLLVGTNLAELRTSRFDSFEDQESSVSHGAASSSCDDSQIKEMREAFELLQTEMRSEVRGLRQEIDSKNEELLKKTEELKDAREERIQLLKRLQWKEEELEHERRSKQWMESELNHKISQLEKEKDELQKTIEDLKVQMDSMRKEMQVMNNQKASVEDFEELQQKVEQLTNRDCFQAKSKPKAMADLEKYTLDFVKKISSLMQQGDSTLTSYKNSGNGQRGSDKNEAVVSSNGQDEMNNTTAHA